MPSGIRHYKDKNKARSYRNKQRKRNYSNGRVHTDKSGMPWTDEEILILKNSSGLTDRELSAVLGRSVQAIQIKRCRI
jgi:hypothetical protein